jgi:hypothetical protein
LCKYLEKVFSIFSRNGTDVSNELRAHYEEWGWISFLSSMSETKVFDIPGSGLDSIECTKRANAYKVLMFASEKHDQNHALHLTYKHAK